MPKILIKTQERDLISEEHLLEVIIRALHLIHFRMKPLNNNLEVNNKRLLRNLNSCQILFLWAKCNHNNNSNKSTIQWQMEFRTKWPTLTTVKVVACNSSKCSSSSSNSAQQCQDMVVNNNNSEACLNKINSRLDLIKDSGAEVNLINNHRLTREPLLEAKILLMLSVGLHNLSNNINSKMQPPSNNQRHLTCSDTTIRCLKL
jgi:hypothetical protein